MYGEFVLSENPFSDNMSRLIDLGFSKNLNKIILLNESNQAWASGLRIRGTILSIDLRNREIRYYTPILEFWRSEDRLRESIGKRFSVEVLGYYRYKISVPEDIRVFEGGFKEAIKQELKDLESKTCGTDQFDSDSELREILGKCTDLREDLGELRSVKSEKEINLISRAAEISMRALKKLLEEDIIGRFERELAARLSYLMRVYGADSEAFPTIVAVDKDAANPHHESGLKVVSLGDSVLVDIGARVNEYNSDMTRMIIHRDSERHRDFIESVSEAIDRALEKLYPGTRASEIDRVARETLEKRGYSKYYIHSTGHGVGVEVHEKPMLSLSSNDIIEENNVVTIEPGIYLRDRIGVRIEELVLVSSRGPKVITSLARVLEYT